MSGLGGEIVSRHPSDGRSSVALEHRIGGLFQEGAIASVYYWISYEYNLTVRWKPNVNESYEPGFFLMEIFREISDFEHFQVGGGGGGG